MGVGPVLSEGCVPGEIPRHGGGYSMHRFWARANVLRLFMVCFVMAGMLAGGVSAATPAGNTITGTFTTIDGDPQHGSGQAAREIYFITDDRGTTTQLSISQQVMRGAGGVTAIDRQKVTVDVGGPAASAPANAGTPVQVANGISLAGTKQAA